MIPYGRHNINTDDIDSVISVLNSDWLTTGPLVQQFENSLEKISGAPCVVVNSGTAALHCAFAAIGLMPGDEIITTPITFIATQATAILFGAKVVFADVQLDTGNIDYLHVGSLVNSRTKAIVIVDYAGHPCELLELRQIADKYGVVLIEDAAHSLGSKYRNQMVGSISDITTFSFFPTKNITTGEGGAISSPNRDLIDKARLFARQGIVRNPEEFVSGIDDPWFYEVKSAGLNYRLNDLQCALGISQLKRIDAFRESKDVIYEFYNSNFCNLSGVDIPTKRSYVEVNWHLYPVRVPVESRKNFFEYLRTNGIGVQVNYIPTYRQPLFGSYEIHYEDFPNSEEFYAREISLPMSSGLTEKELQKVVSVFLDAHKKYIG